MRLCSGVLIARCRSALGRLQMQWQHQDGTCDPCKWDR